MTHSPIPIRVLVVDDSALVREGVKSILASRSGASQIAVVGEAGSVAGGIAEAARLEPDVVLLDIRLPDGSGLQACREILKRRPATRVLILTSHTSEDFTYDAITSGAHGYLMTEIDPDGLVRAIQEIVTNRSPLEPDISAGVLRLMQSGARSDGPDLSSLSAQERRVLALVAEGKTNKQIGDSLGLSDNTVKNYLCSVFDKLHVRRRSQAAAFYVQSKPARSRNANSAHPIPLD